MARWNVSRLRLVARSLLGFLCAACAESPSDERSSVLLIVIDTLRADHLGCYGYGFATSPTLDSLAAEGTRFDQANTPAPITLPAVSSLLTGRYPPGHGVRDNGFFVLPDAVETLAERFRARGFRTGAVIGSDVLAADRGLARGFESYDAAFGGEYPVWDERLRRLDLKDGENRRRADVVTDRALTMLDEFGDRPFFLLAHYFDVHHRYDPPPDFARLHPNRPYDGEIAFVDAEIARLLAALPRADATLVIVVGDHGEGLGDHGEHEHGFLLHESTLRVPFIVSGPGVPAGLVREDPVSLVDVEPTLAAQFDLPSDGTRRDGRALDWTREEPPAPLYGETLRTLVSYRWHELRSVRLGDWKLVRGPTEQLFNLQDDPAELDELSSQEPLAQLSALLDSIAGHDDPEAVFAAAHGAPNPQPRELLESLGYTGPGPSSGFPVDRPHPRDELPRWAERQLAKQLIQNASLLFADEKYEAAIAVVESTLSMVSDNAGAYSLRGDCRLRLGDVDGAREDYGEAVALDSTDAGAHAMLARIALEERRIEDSLRHWEAVVRHDPDHAEALRYVASTYLSRQDVDRALPYLRQLVALDPDDAESHYNLGMAARVAGLTEEAREHLEAFVRLAPQHQQAPTVRAWLR